MSSVSTPPLVGGDFAAMLADGVYIGGGVLFVILLIVLLLLWRRG